MVSLKAACLKGKYLSNIQFCGNLSVHAMKICTILKLSIFTALPKVSDQGAEHDLWKLYLTYVKETKAMLPTYKYDP
jgi:hypothetical protein